MIEIIKKNGNWELYVDGGLLEWNENLSVVVNYLHSHIEDIKSDMFDE